MSDSVKTSRSVDTHLPALELNLVSRWGMISVFVGITALNFLDRQLLAALAPAIRTEFQLSNTDYGFLISAFSLAYTGVAPAAGWFIDRVRLATGIVGALGCWSLAGIATGLSGSFSMLAASRLFLGAAEAAGIPASSKSVALFLRPKEFGLGIATGTLGVMLGMSSAPLIAAATAPQVGWRGVFIGAGALGLILLVPIWKVTSRASRVISHQQGEQGAITRVVRDGRFWGVIACNVAVMINYSLWLNWTTIYFVDVMGLSQSAANQRFAWIPPIAAAAGGLLGGWLGLRVVKDARGTRAAKARARLCMAVSPALLVTSLVPFATTPESALVGICASVFSCMLFLPNLHAIPIDVFGTANAAFTASVLASSYAMAQMILSPWIGAFIDSSGFSWVCVSAAAISILSVPVLWWVVTEREVDKYAAT